MGRRVWTRTGAIVAASLALGAGGALAAGPALRPVSLPRDHGAHAGFGVEWWYTAGTVRGANGHRYFWFATAWSAAQGVVGRVNLLDLGTSRTVLSDQELTATAPRAGQQVIRVGSFTLARGATGPWRVTDRSPTGVGLALTLTPEVPYVLHGRRGLITQGPGGESAYYSQPRLRARGALTVAGRTVALTGLGWLDHQWGNFISDLGALRWNWFACQLADGRDLMLYEFLDAHDRPSGTAAGTLVARGGAVTHLHGFTVTPLAPAVRPPGARATYPLRWRLRVGPVTLRLRSETRAGFIANTVVPSFWEAPAAITAGPAGACIVESSREV